MKRLLLPKPGGADIKYLSLIAFLVEVSFLLCNDSKNLFKLDVTPWNWFGIVLRIAVVHDFYMLCSSMAGEISITYLF